MNDQDLLAVIGRLKFVFAKTLPEIPHEYVIRTEANAADFAALMQAIAERGVPGTFTSIDGRTRRYRYLIIPGHEWRYWRMGLPMLINRARVEEAGR